MSDYLFELNKYFGFKQFRHGQGEIVDSIVKGKNTLVVMPTGGGKSLCYQLPALILEGTAIVISPLIALMKDQVDSLTRAGISATFINSSISQEEINQRMEWAFAGKFKLIYLAPERLESDYFIRQLNKMKISFLAVDEAHCISEWGHDFRPAYLNISNALKKLKLKPVVALTATATPDVQDDIVSALDMMPCNSFIRGFNRPNLSYITEKNNLKILRASEILKKSKKGSNIIYCGSRRSVEETANALKSDKYSVEAYHGGMPQELRKTVQDKFINGDISTIVATNAFGMGVDKPDVRNVIHCDLTQTLEAYYQEAGRAGRDGNESTCHLIYYPNDMNLQEFFINTSLPETKVLKDVYNALYSIGNNRERFIQVNEVYIANMINSKERTVQSVLDYFERHRIISRNNNPRKAKIKFLDNKERIIEFYNNTSELRRKVIDGILRMVSSEVLYKHVDIDILKLKQKFEIYDDDLKETIRSLEYFGLLEYIPEIPSAGIILNLEKMPFENLPLDLNTYIRRRTNAFKKLDLVLNYAETNECKRNYILSYFKETDIDGECGKCSSCINPQSKKKLFDPRKSYLIDLILKAVANQDGIIESKADFVKMLQGKVKNSKNNPYFATLESYTIKQIEEILMFCLEMRYLKKSTKLNEFAIISESGMEKSGMNKSSSNGLSEDHKKTVAEIQKVIEEIASLENIKPRGIASPKTIKRIAEQKPKTKRELLEIEGLSSYYADRYSELILKQFINSNKDITNNFDNVKKTEFESKAKYYYSMIQNGATIAELAKSMKLEPGDIALELEKQILAGADADFKYFCNKEVFAKIRHLVKINKNVKLSELRFRLDEELDFATLRVITAIAKTRE